MYCKNLYFQTESLHSYFHLKEKQPTEELVERCSTGHFTGKIHQTYFPHFFEDLTCNIRIVHRTHRRAKGFDSFLTNNVKACRCRAKNVNEENNNQTNTIQNTASNAGEEVTKTEIEKEETDKEKALNLVKKDWGEDVNVYFTVESIDGNGNYTIYVREGETTREISVYTVNLKTGKFTKE